MAVMAVMALAKTNIMINVHIHESISRVVNPAPF